MIFYKVLESKSHYCVKKQEHIELIKDELLTVKECEKYGLNTKNMQKVEISLRKTFWCFGARFEVVPIEIVESERIEIVSIKEVSKS